MTNKSKKSTKTVDDKATKPYQKPKGGQQIILGTLLALNQKKNVHILKKYM